MRRAKDASGAPLSFPDRVWFPGEWEEVKAIVVSVLYRHFMPGKETDSRYAAYPVVPGYAIYYYAESQDDAPQEVGRGEYKTELDTESETGKVSFNVIDAIQRAGVDAWVRIEQALVHGSTRNENRQDTVLRG